MPTKNKLRLCDLNYCVFAFGEHVTAIPRLGVELDFEEGDLLTIVDGDHELFHGQVVDMTEGPSRIGCPIIMIVIVSVSVSSSRS